MPLLSAIASLAVMPSGPLVPAWIALPLAGVVVLILGAHMHAMARSEMPASRRRIRTATGWVMLITTPLTGYAFGVTSPSDPRGFLLVWLTVAGLLAIIIFLACIDILNSRRLERSEAKELARQMKEIQDRVRDQARAAGAGKTLPDGDYGS